MHSWLDASLDFGPRCLEAEHCACPLHCHRVYTHRHWPKRAYTYYTTNANHCEGHPHVAVTKPLITPTGFVITRRKQSRRPPTAHRRSATGRPRWVPEAQTSSQLRRPQVAEPPPRGTALPFRSRGRSSFALSQSMYQDDWALGPGASSPAS